MFFSSLSYLATKYTLLLASFFHSEHFAAGSHSTYFKSSFPLPYAVSMLVGTPSLTINFTTASTLDFDKLLLKIAVPLLSLAPNTINLSCEPNALIIFIALSTLLNDLSLIISFVN